MDTTTHERLVAEFRARKGQVSGPLAATRLILLTTMDVTTGRPVTDLVEFLHDEEESSLVMAVPAPGDPRPTWYTNLCTDPWVTTENGTFVTKSEARVLEGEQREAAFLRFAEGDHSLHDRQARLAEPIPIVSLRPVSGEPVGGALWGDSLKEVHDGFRRELALIRKEVASSGVGLGAQLRINCLNICAQLHHHHTIEDDEMFPTVDRHHPELASTMARLREEHTTLASLLEELGVLLSDGTDDLDQLRAGVNRLTSQVEAHLDYEEETLIPVLNVLVPGQGSTPLT